MPQLRFSKDKRGYENTFVVQAPKRKGRGRSRILYWFRTPPGVRVGRGPLDEEAIRLLEAGNPDLEFDWTRILKGQDPPAPPAQERRERRGGDQRPRREEAPRPPLRVEPEPAAVVEAEAPAAQPAPAPEIEEPTTAAHARLGSEGLARLRARYSEMLARITDRVPEEERRVELKNMAERLNPDAWVTDDDVTLGLESYETTFAAVRAALGNRR